MGVGGQCGVVISGRVSAMAAPVWSRDDWGRELSP